MPSCSVEGCNNQKIQRKSKRVRDDDEKEEDNPSHKSPQFSIHKFPGDDEVVRRKLWVEFCTGGPAGAADGPAKRNREFRWGGICTSHFLEADYERKGQCFILVEGAVPCLKGPPGVPDSVAPRVITEFDPYILKKKDDREETKEAKDPDVEEALEKRLRHSEWLERMQDPTKKRRGVCSVRAITFREMVQRCREGLSRSWAVVDSGDRVHFVRVSVPDQVTAGSSAPPLCAEMLTMDTAGETMSMELCGGEKVALFCVDDQNVDEATDCVRLDEESVELFIRNMNSRRSVIDSSKALLGFAHRVVKRLVDADDQQRHKKKLGFVGDQLRLLSGEVRCFPPRLLRLAAMLRTMSTECYDALKKEDVLCLPGTAYFSANGCGIDFKGLRERQCIVSSCSNEEATSDPAFHVTEFTMSPTTTLEPEHEVQITTSAEVDLFHILQDDVNSSIGQNVHTVSSQGPVSVMIQTIDGTIQSAQAHLLLEKAVMSNDEVENWVEEVEAVASEDNDEGLQQDNRRDFFITPFVEDLLKPDKAKRKRGMKKATGGGDAPAAPGVRKRARAGTVARRPVKPEVMAAIEDGVVKALGRIRSSARRKMGEEQPGKLVHVTEEVMQAEGAAENLADCNVSSVIYEFQSDN